MGNITITHNTNSFGIKPSVVTNPTDSDIEWVICEAKMDQYINRTLNYYDAKVDLGYGKFDKIMSNIDYELTEDALRELFEVYKENNKEFLREQVMKRLNVISVI